MGEEFIVSFFCIVHFVAIISRIFLKPRVLHLTPSSLGV